MPESLRSRVRLLGRKTPEEVASHRAASDAVVIPSAADNFPFACVEAMAEGRLVIASAGGGLGELMGRGEGGVVFEPGNAESLARAIVQLANQTEQELTTLARGAASRAIAMCGNLEIVAKRIAHYKAVAGRARMSTGFSGTLVIVNPVAESESAVRRLEEAVRAGNVDFAHGWARSRDGVVHVHASPNATSLSLAARVLGPIVMKAEVAEHPAVTRLLRRQRGSGDGDRMQTDSTWSLAMALAAAGFRGAVVPGALFEVPLTEHHPADRSTERLRDENTKELESARHELRTIHESRGWRVLQRVYDALHFLRGRGLRRPTYHQGERANDP